MNFRTINTLEDRTVRVSPEDCRRISDLITENLKYANEIEPRYSPEALREWISFMSPEATARRTEKSYVVLGEENDNLIGCGVLSMVHKGDFEMKRLYIRNDRRGQGLGTAIVEQLEQKARELGLKEIKIDAIAFPSTIRFYEKRGYSVTGQIRDFSNGVLLESVGMKKEI